MIFDNYTLVFGASADPIHQGHIDLITDGTKALIDQGIAVTRIVLMPVYRRNPILHEIKGSLPLTYEHRFHICQLATHEIARNLAGLVQEVSVSRLEQALVSENQRPNYTAETLSALRDTLDEKTGIVFMLGEDVFSGDPPGFSKWYKVDRILELALIAICPRPGFGMNQDYLEHILSKGAKLVFLKGLRTKNISSHQLKLRLKAGEDPLQLARDGWISYSIATYIKEVDLVRLWQALEPADKNKK